MDIIKEDSEQQFEEKSAEQAGSQELPIKTEIASSFESEVSTMEGEKKDSIVIEKEDAYSNIMSKVKDYPMEVSESTIISDAENVSAMADAESQVRQLVNIAIEKGVPYAVGVARHFEDNYVLDKFHDDLLADKLHVALLERGLIIGE